METSKCDNCGKTASELEVKLKHCAKCKKVKYCSRECQKANWKQHKPTCREGPGAANNAQTSTTNSSPCAIPKPFTALKAGSWLKNRPENDVYKLLVDVYRLRVEDQYKFEGEVDEGSMYAGGTASSALRVYRKFLQKMTRLDSKRPADKKILPGWWNPAKLSECVEFAREGSSTGDDWSMIGYAVEKHDIQDHYKDQAMPMQMRMFSEQIDGRLVMGQSGKQMMNMRAEAEAAGTPSTILDVSSMLAAM